MTKHQICPVCFGVGKGLKFQTSTGLIPFIRILQLEQHRQQHDASYAVMAKNFIAEVGFEKYLGRIFNHRIKVTKMDLTCLNCLGEGIVISSDQDNPNPEPGPDWSDQGNDGFKDFLEGIGFAP